MTKYIMRLQQKLDTMSTQYEAPKPTQTPAQRQASENARRRDGRVMKDRDELARKDVLSYTRLKGVTFWKITDLYKDTYYFNYVVDEFVRETRRHGCSWVAAPAPRALPILGAVGLKARLPACYIHKQGELPVRPNALLRPRTAGWERSNPTLWPAGGDA